MDGAKRTQVLIIPSWYPSSDSPVNGVFIREQARALATRMNVSVLTPRFPSLKDQMLLWWGPVLVNEDDQGIDVWKIRKLKIPTLRRWLPLLNHPDNALVYYRKFAAAVRAGFAQYVAERGVPDLLHAHVVLPAGWIAVELARQYSLPLVLTEHSEPFAMHLASPRQTTLVRSILHGANRVVAVSGSLRATLQTLCPDVSVDVVGNVIDTDFFTPGPVSDGPKRPFRFFALCLLTERKGIQFLFQAVHMLRSQGVEAFEVLVGGDGPYRATLEKLADDLGIRSQCRFLGLLNRQEVREQMQACDVFVLPSLGETFGVVLGEAMASGKPVLSTRCGGPEEVVTPETGILVAPADACELADAMAGFLSRRYHFQSDVIRDSVNRRYGAASFVESMTTIYTETLHEYGMRQGIRTA